MEKTISIRNTEITFSIWDLGGQREFVNMLPLVCNDAVAILFMFDLSRKSTLNSIKEWYRQARGFNKVLYAFCIYFLLMTDCNSVSSRHKVWSSRQLPKRRPGGNHETGFAFRYILSNVRLDDLRMQWKPVSSSVPLVTLSTFKRCIPPILELT